MCSSGTTSYLSNESTKCMKGICAVLVLCHHLYRESGLFGGSFLGVVFQAMGYLSVGMFFFFSGYGLMHSLLSRKGYADTFLKRRFLPLYLFYVGLVFLYSAYSLALGREIYLSWFFQSFGYGGTVVIFGWFFQVLFVVYLMFYVLCKVISDPSRLVTAFTVCLVGYSVLCSRVLGMSVTWYESSFCVVLGMLCALKKESLDRALARRGGTITLICAALFVLCFYGSKHFPLSTLFMIGSSLFFDMTVVGAAYMLQDTSVIRNRVTLVLGEYSLAIYSAQGFMIGLRKGPRIRIENLWLFVIVVLLGTALISIVLKRYYDSLKRYITTC